MSRSEDYKPKKSKNNETTVNLDGCLKFISTLGKSLFLFRFLKDVHAVYWLFFLSILPF